MIVEKRRLVIGKIKIIINTMRGIKEEYIAYNIGQRNQYNIMVSLLFLEF